MNYVGQLAETVYEAVKELYQGLNPATLSGGVDVLVVKHPDGSFLCSPFHVRFGKLDVLRTREQVVSCRVRGSPSGFSLPLGRLGSGPEYCPGGRESLPPLGIYQGTALCSTGDRAGGVAPSPASGRELLGLGVGRWEAQKKNEKRLGSAVTADTSSDELEEAYETFLEEKEITDSSLSYLMGPKDIYLEDLPSLNSSSTALYFPPSCSRCDDKFCNESTCSETIDPKCLVPEQKTNITLSLCGGLNENQSVSTERFSKYTISYQDFVNDPGILQDPRLVVKIGDKHYNWAVAAPMILSLQAFQKTLPKVRTPSPSIFPDPLDPDVNFGTPPVQPPVTVPNFKKTLRLSSDQIRNLNLKEGSNDVVFSVTTQYQGTCRCQATIYLWNCSDKVVVSDIDGTITKSDALGHILPQLGKDWTHTGIIRLYHKIHLNGYKFLYCSARAIGMADITKRYLKWVSDQGCVLPRGPLLLTPSSLFSALHREVVEKKPEVFKIACLRDILHLFKHEGNPFYAGFGNRSSDVRAYLHVGVPKCRIFTVNPQGQLIQELVKNHKTTFEHLQETVEHMFPPTNAGPSVQLLHPEFSGFCYWRQPLVEINLSDLN
uniref:phosphatidate phosphatase n=1 Tax=Monodelphis domestica TaxID=13616 RepID=A0A5F8G2J6_MONDO